ncbi:amino acid ABC transporter substrate-binding protein (PAAT family) [Isoptericola sp. CG 20/1183]|uniref:Amino acid ABC transporter substrate-binding protein (PAAT family) n=1 Tax=Isoptericola halotolerans TaxID=300560 RepID=A0ABX5ECP2_9MICO|nr:MULTISPECIES: glutamate ABC transporter substrate-binding protein [Isoptericola]MCK0116649.1 glutamate ABC transporter substrate-binding protein [Isoptericola sp. S6320L]PRZ05615.1 amino acid ABC transporter substrate-binding protein (PAAT family) [Isoptericola halotolerans]PRZ06183.1 amino acid ABC transporter substrate-binding protein (PAAT family) [Isoptericola sp. CG 20/1183]
MRTRTTGAIALAATAALTLAACSDDSGSGGGETEGGDDSVTIGIKFDQPGLGFMEGDTPSGFDVEVAKYVANELGYSEDQIEWTEAPSAQRETLLSTGQVDMIFATYSITDERREQVSFAGPYFVAGQDLLVAADNTDITGPDTLDGKNLCSVTGSTSAQRIKDEYSEGVNLLEQPGYAECVTALIAGQVDAVTTDDIILAGLGAQPSNAGQVKVVGNTFSEELYGVGIPQESDQCEAINEAITKMVDDGSWQEALDAATEGTGYVPNDELNPPEYEPCDM